MLRPCSSGVVLVWCWCEVEVKAKTVLSNTEHTAAASLSAMLTSKKNGFGYALCLTMMRFLCRFATSYLFLHYFASSEGCQPTLFPPERPHLLGSSSSSG